MKKKLQFLLFETFLCKKKLKTHKVCIHTLNMFLNNIIICL